MFSKICWLVECSAFIASSFRIWNSSAGILSPSLVLFVVKLPKAHLTLPSRMQLVNHTIVIWVIETFWYISFVFSCHLFFISSASAGSFPFLSFIMPILAWNVPLIALLFLKRSLVFPILFFPYLFIQEGFISLCYSLELYFQLSISFPFSFAFHFSLSFSYLWSLLRKPFCLLAFLFLWDGCGHCLLYNVTDFCP